jgi:HD superfamily phosphodiesterase
MLAELLHDYVRIAGHDPQRKKHVVLAVILSKQLQNEIKTAMQQEKKAS